MSDKNDRIEKIVLDYLPDIADVAAGVWGTGTLERLCDFAYVLRAELGNPPTLEGPSREQLMAAMDLCADDEAFFVRHKDGDVVPVLMLNDTFGYAVADGEEIPWSEVIELRDRIREDGWPAGVWWAAKRRGQEPIGPVKDAIEEHVLHDSLTCSEIAEMLEEYFQYNPEMLLRERTGGYIKGEDLARLLKEWHRAHESKGGPSG